jgi:aldose 1-epimerase
MSFTISHQNENGLQQIVLTDSETGASVCVLPSCGALLHAFIIHTPGGSFNIIDNYKSLDDFKNTVTASHKSSKLSPFVCRIKEGKYHFNGDDFEFVNKFSDGSAIHGLLVKKTFEVTDEYVHSESANVSMKYDYKKDDAAYPFDYRCTVSYQLKKNRELSVETTLLNTGTQHIPIADGWHPYFTLQGKTNDWELCLRAKQMLEFDEKLIPTSKLIPSKKFQIPEKIGDTFLDSCYVLDAWNGEAACSLRNPANDLELLFFAGERYPFLQIFTPPHRESIAIENLSGAPDCFNNRIGLTVLEPGQSQTFTLGYQVLIS